MAQWGQLGEAPTASFKQRHYADLPRWTLSKTMERQLDFTEMLLDLEPQRGIHVLPSTLPSIVVAR